MKLLSCCCIGLSHETSSTQYLHEIETPGVRDNPPNIQSFCDTFNFKNETCAKSIAILKVNPISTSKEMWSEVIQNSFGHSKVVLPSALADLEGVPGARPLRVRILSFLHTKFLKRNRLVSPRPPTGNPGSATDLV